LAVGVLASTTYNNFIADLLFLSEVSHSLLVAGAPCVHPYLGKSALGGACVWRVWRGLVYGPRLVEGTHIAPVASRCSPRPPVRRYELRPLESGCAFSVLVVFGFWFLVSRRSSSSPEPQRRWSSAPPPARFLPTHRRDPKNT
jgi:hypothetical protein